jgi:DNA-binding NarL/FixJ family response regulator
MKIPVLIYEDNNTLREGLGNLLKLSEDFDLAGSYADAKEVQSQVTSLNPQVILMDIDLPGINGIEAVRIIRKFNSQVQIIMLTVFDDSTHVFDALSAGANGYLLKKYVSDKLFHAIREVLDGGGPMSPTIARLIIGSMQKNTTAQKEYHLTQRELETLQLLSKGNSFKMIAELLSISVETVRTHIKKVYEKLHVNSQLEAVSKAINEKLV